METLRLVLGLLLPWALGIALVAAIRDCSRAIAMPGEIAWITGAGYLVGAFALTLWMRARSIAGIRFGVVPIGLPLVALIVALAWIASRRERAADIAVATLDALRALVRSPGLDGASRVLWISGIVWLAIRFLLLALEVTWQPLYPWDAWIQWATKARACYALGRWDDALMNWPWWQFALALALATYGGLRRLDVGAGGSLAGAFMIASLPLANVHVALAGYADLPLAAFYAMGVLAFLHWHRSRRGADAIVSLFLLAACTQTKNPGIVWALT